MGHRYGDGFLPAAAVDADGRVRVEVGAEGASADAGIKPIVQTILDVPHAALVTR
jgi:hypothetical protein